MHQLLFAIQLAHFSRVNLQKALPVALAQMAEVATA